MQQDLKFLSANCFPNDPGQLLRFLLKSVYS